MEVLTIMERGKFQLFKIILGVLSCALLMAMSASADVTLPKPTTNGGEGIFDLIQRRASGARDNFPKGAISDEELSTILWAATGINRGRSDKAWTIPTAGGLPPYVEVYAVKNDGVYLYDWKAHALTTVSDKNALGDITNDSFVKESPVVLILVSDTANLGAMGRLNEGNALAYIATGAMSQNIYLAADTLGISTRYMVSMNTDGVKRELKLTSDGTPLCVLPLGKR
ncbi:MAG: SagB/ThcOx family dehydrogenase [Synergistaceae bacterium]|jgi:SagB-type dehydrogenase family enzyme|nr:SagB/ThcOx family dehydrogenase [Synergistaceae bacterium]